MKRLFILLFAIISVNSCELISTITNPRGDYNDVKEATQLQIIQGVEKNVNAYYFDNMTALFQIKDLSMSEIWKPWMYNHGEEFTMNSNGRFSELWICSRLTSSGDFDEYYTVSIWFDDEGQVTCLASGDSYYQYLFSNHSEDKFDLTVINYEGYSEYKDIKGVDIKSDTADSYIDKLMTIYTAGQAVAKYSYDDETLRRFNAGMDSAVKLVKSSGTVEKLDSRYLSFYQKAVKGISHQHGSIRQYGISRVFSQMRNNGEYSRKSFGEVRIELQEYKALSGGRLRLKYQISNLKNSSKGCFKVYMTWYNEDEPEICGEVYLPDVISNGTYEAILELDKPSGFYRIGVIVYSDSSINLMPYSEMWYVNLSDQEFFEDVDDEVMPVTVAEFIEAEVSPIKQYLLRGTITEVTNAVFGDFYLTDETGTVYIYGLYSPEGADRYWEESGAKLGDDIVIRTTRSEYNGPEGASSRFVALISPGTHPFLVQANNVAFNPEGGTESIKVAYNTSDYNVYSPDYHFSVEHNEGTLTITAPKNESEDPIIGEITVALDDESVIIMVSQDGTSTYEAFTSNKE